MITAVDTNILLDVLIPGAGGMKTRFRVRKLCEDGMPFQSASSFRSHDCGALCDPPAVQYNIGQVSCGLC
jgi:hypothetical protein